MKMNCAFAAATLVAASAAVAGIQPGLYAVQSVHGDDINGLFRIDPATGHATKITSLSHNPSLTGATFLNGQLYVSDVFQFNPNAFYGTLDVETGQYSGIHDQGFDLNWHGLASSDALGVTWSISQQNNRMLVQTDLAGNMTNIGPTGVDGRGMAYDDKNGILYAINFDDASLYSIDTATGQSTLIGATGTPCDVIGLAYDEINEILYMTEAYDTNSLYTLDVATGQATLVGATGEIWLDGLAWIPSPSTLSVLALGAVAARRRRS